jgi:hypothetical protein
MFRLKWRSSRKSETPDTMGLHCRPPLRLTLGGLPVGNDAGREGRRSHGRDQCRIAVDQIANRYASIPDLGLEFPRSRTP